MILCLKVSSCSTPRSKLWRQLQRLASISSLPASRLITSTTASVANALKAGQALIAVYQFAGLTVFMALAYIQTYVYVMKDGVEIYVIWACAIYASMAYVVGLKYANAFMVMKVLAVIFLFQLHLVFTELQSNQIHVNVKRDGDNVYAIWHFVILSAATTVTV